MTKSSKPPTSIEDHGRQRTGVETPDLNAADISRYVADMCGEMSKMTKSVNLLMLSYLLAMARQEAERIARDGVLTK